MVCHHLCAQRAFEGAFLDILLQADADEAEMSAQIKLTIIKKSGGLGGECPMDTKELIIGRHLHSSAHATRKPAAALSTWDDAARAWQGPGQLRHPDPSA